MKNELSAVPTPTMRYFVQKAVPTPTMRYFVQKEYQEFPPILQQLLEITGSDGYITGTRWVDVPTVYENKKEI